MSTLLDIGVTGLTAHQRALATTGHNIANANVEGYSRQDAVFETLAPRFDNGNFVGTGVGIDAIRRITDELLVRQSFTDASRLRELETLSAGIEQIDSLLSNEETGLSGALGQLFSSLQAVSESPTSLPLRQQVINDAQRFITRYQNVHGQLKSIVEQTDGLLVGQVGSINSISSAIAELNTSIGSVQVGQSNDLPNDLLDKRDQLMRELAEKVSFTTSESGGMVNIFIAGGQALVLGAQANRLTTVGNAASGNGVGIAIVVSGQQRVITDKLSGGDVGGVLQLRSAGVDQAYNQLGLMQSIVADTFNTLHKEGVDLNGNAGLDFFTPINDRAISLARVIPSFGNTGSDTVVSVNVDDVAALQPSGYVLQLNSAGNLFSYTVQRQSDGATVSEGVLAPIFPQSIPVADGFTINLESGSFQAGDVFTISPARVPPEALELRVTDPSALALALPLSTQEGIGNIGSGIISQVEALNLNGLDTANAGLIAQLRAQTPPLLIRFTGDNTFDVLDNSDPTQPVPLSPPLRNLPFIPGQSNNVLDFDLQATVTTSSGVFAFSSSASAAGTTTNGYTGESIIVGFTDPNTGVFSSTNVNTVAGESAAIVAARINGVPGVTATANTEMTVDIFDNGIGQLFQLRLNGVDITDSSIGAVPNPATNDFLVQRINQLFAGSGISAKSNGTSIFVRSTKGEDLTLEKFGGGLLDSVVISEINGTPSAVGIVLGQEATVGGTVDVIADNGYSLSSGGGHFGASTAVAVTAHVGYPTSISGRPAVGDEFLINAGGGSPGDNRNALALAGVQSADIALNGSSSIDDIYTGLVGAIGSKALAARVDSIAAQSIFNHTQDRLSAVAGVNLDEEAAKLLQYEQVYNASARIIAVARSVFDSLLSAFS